MKILLSMPNDGQSNNYIINALQDLQHDVFFVDHRNNLKECLDVVPKIIKQHNIDIMLVLYLVEERTYTQEYIKKLKMHFPSVLYISWLFDIIIKPGIYAYDDENLISLIREYDYFFTVAKGHIDKFKEKGVNAHWAREGCCPYSHFPVELINQDGKRIKNLDVSFIGQIGHEKVHNDRVKLIETIVKKYDNVRIYGKILGNIPELIYPYHMFRPTYNDAEHNKIVGRSKINIGHSGWTDVDGYFSARNYRICGAKGFLLANNSMNIRDSYSENEMVTYDSIDDCIDKIDYYIKQDELREQMSINAYNRTMNEYTFSHSLKNILKIIDET